MNNPYGMITIRHRINHNAKGKQVLDIVKLPAQSGITLYLLVYTVDVLGPARQLCLQANFLKLPFNNINYLSDKPLSLDPAGIHQIDNPPVLLRLQVAKSQVFQLPL